jgi:hypothetical protein
MAYTNTQPYFNLIFSFYFLFSCSTNIKSLLFIRNLLDTENRKFNMNEGPLGISRPVGSIHVICAINKINDGCRTPVKNLKYNQL